ncbi:IucA/IucC family C-terminal-domain containing protein [Bacillus dakarensis]|uniref:IucA/IucC family C-terminal-domain containing protein n=1 Tax=Robertmurraya dakarensis TaxID=1926278 RepID=UPI00111573FF|nr:IucA/IucC family C-terminal-domain containing protein [Bacillus dakarensis]
MADVLSKEEINQLRQFRFTAEEDAGNQVLSVSKLFTEENLNQYLNTLSGEIGSPNIRVTASMFVKRYAFLAVIYLYGVSAWNKRLNPSFRHIFLITSDDDQVWLPKFFLQDQSFESVSLDRKKWVEAAIRDFFADHMAVLLDLISKVTKQSKHILWENIAIYIFWLYESILLKSENKEAAARAGADFDFLIHEAPSTLFGERHSNPLRKFFTEKNNEVRIRKTCCFHYLLEGESRHCKTCPKTCNMT